MRLAGMAMICIADIPTRDEGEGHSEEEKQRAHFYKTGNDRTRVVHLNKINLLPRDALQDFITRILLTLTSPGEQRPRGRILPLWPVFRINLQRGAGYQQAHFVSEPEG